MLEETLSVQMNLMYGYFKLYTFNGFVLISTMLEGNFSLKDAPLEHEVKLLFYLPRYS